MSDRIYNACKKRVSEQHGLPPASFLDQVIETMNLIPDQVFEIRNLYNIYSVMLGSLGPYSSLLHRKAVMCEVLRVQAAFESDWRWDCGVDVTNDRSTTHRESEETGAFQVSWDSMSKDSSLKACVQRYTQKYDVDTFLKAMKTDHALAVEYCARLLTFSTKWCGTLNDTKKVIAHVRREAVDEFQSFLVAHPQAHTDAPDLVDTLATHLLGRSSDAQFIGRLLEIATDITTLQNAQLRAGKKLLQYDGEIFPHNACAITLSTLLQDAGINVPDEFRALSLGKYLHEQRNWEIVRNGDQQPGDVGSTCGKTAKPGSDHIYLVLRRIDEDKMIVVDNQKEEPHVRFVSVKGKSVTTFFLRAS